MKAIVLLLTKKTGRVGSEEYVYLNIERIEKGNDRRQP